MAFYDSGVRYDSGIRYDEGAGPPPPVTTNHHRLMANVKLELQDKSDEELKAFILHHINQMTGNANFPTPSPSAAEFATKTDPFIAKLAEVASLVSQLDAARADLKPLRAEAELALTSRGNYVESAADKDAGKILSSGLGVKGQAAPLGELPAPIEFLAKMGKQAGRIDLKWKPVRGAGSYVLDCREHDVPGATWQQAKIVTAAKVTVEGLTTGKVYAFRVRAVGAAGEGAWSDETVMMAP